MLRRIYGYRAGIEELMEEVNEHELYKVTPEEEEEFGNAVDEEMPTFPEDELIASSDLEVVDDALSQAEDTSEGLEAIRDLMIQSLNKGGLDKQSAIFASFAVNKLMSNTLPENKEILFPSLESIDEVDGRKKYTEYAIESLGESIENAIKNVFRLINTFIEKAKEFFNKIITKSKFDKTLIKGVLIFAKKIDESKGAAEKEVTVSKNDVKNLTAGHVFFPDDGITKLIGMLAGMSDFNTKISKVIEEKIFKHLKEGSVNMASVEASDFSTYGIKFTYNTATKLFQSEQYLGGIFITIKLLESSIKEGEFISGISVSLGKAHTDASEEKLPASNKSTIIREIESLLKLLDFIYDSNSMMAKTLEANKKFMSELKVEMSQASTNSVDEANTKVEILKAISKHAVESATSASKTNMAVVLTALAVTRSYRNIIWARVRNLKGKVSDVVSAKKEK